MRILGFVVLLVVVLLTVSAWRRRRFRNACYAVFERVYANWSPVPKLEMSSSYGFPAFKVIFKSEPEILAAVSAGLNREFLRQIDELCKDQGSKDRPFSAEIATYFAYETA